MIYKALNELVGNTPLYELSRYCSTQGISGKLLAKLEYLNPTGSIKDRAALRMIETAEKTGRISKGALIIEPTSGNTGIGLAAVCASQGYRVMFTMPETMSAERQRLLRAYGAKVTLTPGAEGMQGAIRVAHELAAKEENSFIPSQFSNPANAEAHYLSTGPEIWRDTNGDIDALVCGVGSGGTITGAGKYLKEKNPNIHIVAVEPKESAVLSGKQAAPHQIQGIGAGFIPDALDTSVYDEIMPIAGDDAIKHAKLFAQSEGIFVGISSGAALCAGAQLARGNFLRDKCIVLILPDSGDRYLSTRLAVDSSETDA